MSQSGNPGLTFRLPGSGLSFLTLRSLPSLGGRPLDFSINTQIAFLRQVFRWRNFQNETNSLHE
jgi:hypothetical protein